MKKMLAVCAFVLVAAVAGAQKVYFIYIQSDNNTPFFVKLGDKVTTATASGYVILPKLLDSVYQFAIGKTGDATSESRFSVTINKQDKGFLLRETDGKFSLFDLQALTSLQPVAAAGSASETISKRTDAFSVLLAQAANDPSLLEVRTAVATTQAETKKPEATPAVSITAKEPENEVPQQQTTDTNAATPTDVAVETTPEKKEPQIETPIKDTVQQATVVKEVEPQATATAEATPYKRSIVTRKSESSTSEGFGLTFLDKMEDGVDTIQILISNQNFAVRNGEAEHGDLKKFLNITNTDSAKTETTVDAANEKLRAAETKKRRACAEAAGEKDFFKLRRNMAAKVSEEAMLAEANKAFKKTCFSTEQIKNLSALFLTAGGKYQFFDAAYGHVSNQEQYNTLQAELSDAYYVNRFKALIANQ